MAKGRENASSLKNDFDIPMTQTLELKVQAMCNLSQGIEEKGRIKGRAEGKAEERLSAIRNLMASMGWSVEQAMEALWVPEAERQKYAVQFQKQ